jgi:hypothetical protein
MQPDGVLLYYFLEDDSVYFGRIVPKLKRTLVHNYQTARCDIPQDLNFYSHNGTNFKFSLSPYLQRPEEKCLQLQASKTVL